MSGLLSATVIFVTYPTAGPRSRSTAAKTAGTVRQVYEYGERLHVLSSHPTLANHQRACDRGTVTLYARE